MNITFTVLVVVLLLPIQQKACTCAATANKQRCLPSSCGKLTNISHPFSLKGDPPNCGDPRYELACEDNVTTVLSLFSGKYHVQAIDYNNYTVRVVDPGIQHDVCSSIPRYFLALSNFTDSYSSSYDYPSQDPYQSTSSYPYYDRSNPVIYLKCSNRVRDDAKYVDTAPCLNSKGHFYAVAGDLPLSNVKSDCRVNLVALTSSPALGGQAGLYDMHPMPSNHTFSYAEIHRMLAYGFDLSWIRFPCESYCRPQDFCYFDETSENNLRCSSFCFTPLGFRYACGTNISKLRFMVEDYVFGILTGLFKIENGDIPILLSDDVVLNIATEMGVITGRYVLPYLTVRFILGLITFFVLLIYTCRRRHMSGYENIEDFLQGNTLMPIRYSYKEIKQMTRGFKDKLGEGGYGTVYKGKLRSGPFVAIKMLGKPKANGQEFINEVATIGKIHHANVVRLTGFCVEGSKRALVYEFMTNGSLDRYIFSKEGGVSLPYEKMYEISLGVARGITYLHQGCDMQILHFDIKPHNILLDENFIPRVSDFGLAKLYPIDNSIVTLTAARGTLGYMAPELFYQNIGGVSYKADVYSFGMLLMEMASNRRNLNPHAKHSSQLYFPFWIYDQLSKDNEIEMVEIMDEGENKVAKKMFMVALWCIQLKPTDRPSMNKVLEMLEGEVESIEMPPKPSLYPHETIQEDHEIDSDQITSNDFSGSTSYTGEDTTNPLIMNSG